MLAAWLALGAWCPPAAGQTSPQSTPGNPAATQPPLSYGAEIGFGSGHADRGFIISDGPVVQPVAWLSGRLAQFSVWSSFTLAQTADTSRPRILEFELTREYRWGKFTIAPAITTYFYHDLLSLDSDHSVEGWLHLSYHAGPVRLFTDQSLDVLTYRGAYFGEAGIETEQHLSPLVEVGGSLGAGWASSRFNDAYAGVARTAFDRISVQGWLTAHVRPHGYIGPHFEFSNMVNPGVRAGVERPTFLLVGLTTGVEF